MGDDSAVSGPGRVLPLLRRPGFVVTVWLIVVLVARYWAQAMQDAGRVIRLKAPPLVGFDVSRVGWRNIAVIVLAVALVWFLPRWSRRGSWPVVVGTAPVLAGAWGLALAVVDGWAGITRGVRWKSDEYIFNVGDIDSPTAFLSGFTDQISGYVTHVRGHPPGMVLILWVMDRLGLSGFGWNAALYIVVGVSATAAVLLAVRELTDETTARSAAPFLILAPAAIWTVTTADAFFAGVGAWAVTLVVIATGRTGVRRDGLALAGGLLFGVLTYLSYGLVLLAMLPLAVAGHRRSWRPIVMAVIGAIPVAVAFTAAGFWWFEGLGATRLEYVESVARDRPYWTFLFFNTAALAIALGPAVVAGLVGLRDRRLWWLVGPALAAVVAANLSGMSKGEVERIWLPFTVWLLAGGVGLLQGVAVEARVRVMRTALAIQAAVAILVQSGVKPRW